jgi:NADH-quinone oxidoreductase subunit E
LDDLVAAKTVKGGPQVDRQLSAPVGGLTTLTDPALYRRDNGGPRRDQAALSDAAAKKPGEPANMREAVTPKPPIDDSSRRR